MGRLGVSCLEAISGRGNLQPALTISHGRMRFAASLPTSWQVRYSMLPRRPRRRQNLLNSHGFQILRKLTAEDPVAVAKQVPRDLLKGEGLTLSGRLAFACGPRPGIRYRT